MRRRRETPTAARLLVAPVLLSLLGGLAGCSGDDEDDPDDGGSSVGGTPAEGVDTRVEVGEVAGRLAKGPARGLAEDVAAVVDRWLEAAYVGGEYPRTDFADAYPGFTKDAATLAARQRGVMSNAGVGDRVEDVTATRSVVRVDVLAPKGKPAGATAHVNLVIELTGGVERVDQVRGRVVLRKSEGQWRIFGFDVERGEVKG